MSYADTIAPFLNRIMTGLPSLLFGFLILVVGYLVARVTAGLLGRTLRATTVDRRVAELLGLEPPLGERLVEKTASRIAFWLVMLFVLIGFFNQVGLPLVAEPLRAMIEKVVSAAPNLLEAALILAVAWIVGAVLRIAVTRIAVRLELEQRLRRYVGLDEAEVSGLPQRAGAVVFYLVLVLAVPPFLGALGQSATVDPLVDMFRVTLTYLPNILAGLLTVGIGWIVARLLREVARNVLVGAGLDRAAERINLAETMGDVRPSNLVATIVYFVVWVPFIVAGLDALKIEAISRPAVAALNALLVWVPKGLGAAVLVILAWIVSRFLGNLVAQLVRGVGFDGLPVKLGLTDAPRSVGGRTLSELAGVVATALILLFALIEAMEVIGLAQLAAFGERLAGFGVNVVIAGAIVGAGLWIGAYIQRLLQEGLERAGSPNPRLVGLVGRYAVVAFAFAMALQQVGFGQSIVVTAFTLIFGAACLAAALAFGLGARDAAGRAVQRFLEAENPQGSR